MIRAALGLGCRCSASVCIARMVAFVRTLVVLSDLDGRFVLRDGERIQYDRFPPSKRCDLGDLGLNSKKWVENDAAFP